MLRFSQLAGTFIIVRLAPEVAMPEWVTSAEFTSITRTADELSIVCPIENVHEEMKAGPRWICLRLEGIPIFAISTYDTDYVLVQEEFAATALAALQKAGHELASI
jgi:uncharacterized protein